MIINLQILGKFKKILYTIFVKNLLLAMKKNILQFLLISSFLFFSCKTDKNQKITKLSGNIFGTTYHITYLSVINYQKQIDSLFHLVNKSLSTYIPTSDISKINKGDTTVIVDSYFIEVFNKSKKIFNETNGFFDPTVGNLVNAWGFGPKKEQQNLDSIEIQKQLKLVGFQMVSINKQHKVKKKYSNIFLDFNANAKGYGIDIIGRYYW